MSKIFLFLIACVFVSNGVAAEVFSFVLTESAEEQIQKNCPWIQADKLQKIVIIPPEKIGWSGGEGGNILGELFEDTGIDVNYSIIKGNLPEEAKAIVLETQYYTNDGSAEVILNELVLTQLNGDQISLWLDDTQRIMSQVDGEILVVCFEDGEQVVRLSVKATHQSVDGARPTLGVSALVDVP